MGTLREVQGKQRVQGIGNAVLILACVSVLALAGGCSRAMDTTATAPESAPAGSVVAASPANPSAAGTAAPAETSARTEYSVMAGTAAATDTAATAAIAAPAPTTAASPATSAPSAPAPVLYESIAFGVRASETSGWMIQKSFDTPSLKVVFGYEKIQAILSVLSPDKTGKAIMGELLQGLGDVEVLVRTDNSLEVRTRYANSMRTIAYVERAGRFNYLLVFVTPDSGVEQRRDAVASLISGLDYLG